MPLRHSEDDDDGFTRNKDDVILRPKIEKRNKRPPSNKCPSSN